MPIIFLVFFFIVGISNSLQANVISDTIPISNSFINIDSLILEIDSLYLKSSSDSNRKIQLRKFNLNRILDIAPSDVPRLNKPSIELGNGYINLASTYTSRIDTPIAQSKIFQQQALGSQNVRILSLPLEVSYLIRISSSNVYRDIYSIRVSLNQREIENSIQWKYKEAIRQKMPQLKDTIYNKVALLKNSKFYKLREWINSPVLKNQVISAKEKISVPEVTFKPSNSLGENFEREKEIKLRAAKFLRIYYYVDSLVTAGSDQFSKLNRQIDSLKSLAARISNFSLEPTVPLDTLKSLFGELEVARIKAPNISKFSEHLASVSEFSLGRTVINYDDLVSNNVGINGINLEYKRKYYASFSAGIVENRFRDVIFNIPNQNKQYFVLGRFGMGDRKKSNVIFSAFSGTKQFLSYSGSQNNSFRHFKGYGLSGRISIFKGTTLGFEFMESFSPARLPAKGVTSDNIKTNVFSNNALSIKVSSTFLHNTRFEASYRFFGNEFQSFNNFQNNSSVNSFFFKVTKGLFKDVLRVTASIKTNDFNSPYLLNSYSSRNTTQNFQLGFRKRKYPVVSVGYFPISQLTYFNDQILETRFQALNSLVSHTYKVSNASAVSSVMVNKYFNNLSDSIFLHSNATNLQFSQSIILAKNTFNLIYSNSLNNQYSLQMFEQSVQFPMQEKLTLGFGIRVLNYNYNAIKMGGFVNGSITIDSKNIVQYSVDKSYIPGFEGQLLDYNTGSIHYVRFFGK